MSTDIRASNLSYDNEFHEKSLIVDMERSNEGASGILMSTWLTSLPFAAAQTDGEERVNMERIFSNSTETCRNVVDAAKHFDSFNQQNFWVVGPSSNCSSEADSYTSLVDPEIISYWQDYSWPSGSGGVSCVSSARLPENEGYVLREECPPLHEGFPAPFVGDDASMSTSLQKILSSGIPACLGNPIQELMEHSRVQIEKFTVKQKSDEDFTFEGQDVMSVAGVRENPVEINFKEEMQRIDQKRKMDEDTIPSQKRYCAKQSIPSQAVHINPAGFENDENPQSSRSSRNNNLKLPSVEQTLSQDVGPAVNTNGKPRARRGSATDPQSVYARQRRERINERLKILQNLVPNGAKVDLSTMLEEAIQYVKFLQLQIKLLSSDEYWMYAPIAYNKIDAALDMRIGL